jgi:hypothetical protein
LYVPLLAIDLKKMRKTSIVFILVSGMLLAACDNKSEAPGTKLAASVDKTCSSPLALQLISQILSENAEKNGREANITVAEDKRLDLAKIRALAGEIKLSLDDVLTTKNDPNSSKKFCEATLALVVPNSTITDANEKRRSVGESLIKTIAEDASFKVDGDKYSLKISYNVQPTDDGKKIYVEIENPKPFHLVVNSAVMWAALRLPSSGSSNSGSIQKAIEATPSPTTASTPSAAADNPPKSELAIVNEDYSAAEHDINFLWKSLPKAIRDENLEAQKAFNAEKELICSKEAKNAGDGDRFEIARNKCWARMYRARNPFPLSKPKSLTWR